MSEEKWSIDKVTRDEIVARVTEARQAGANARYLSAVATHAVVSVDGIGEGRLYASQGDYAKALGVSASQVSGLKSLGAVIAETGITSTDADWQVISNRAGNLGKYLKGQAKNGKPVTRAGVLRTAKEADKVAKAAVESARQARNAGGSTPAAPADVLSLFAEVQSALDTVRKAATVLTPADRQIVRNSLATLLDDYAVKGDKADKAS